MAKELQSGLQLRSPSINARNLLGEYARAACRHQLGDLRFKPGLLINSRSARVTNDSAGKGILNRHKEIVIQVVSEVNNQVM